MILLALLTMIGLDAQATPRQILHLSLRCRDAAVTHDAAVIGRQLRRHNPGAEVRSVVMTWPCNDTFAVQDAAAAELKTRLAKVTEGRPHLDLLALDLPDGDAGHPTLMMPLGHLEADGLSTQMREALAPLRGRGRRDARVVLTAGHGLSGPEEAAAQRARQLLEFIGSPEGSVFGLEQPKLLFERPSRKDLDLGLLMVAVAIGFDQMMWLQPKFTFGRILLSGIYSLGFRMLHTYAASFVFGDSLKPAAEGGNVARFNMMLSSILGTIVAAAQVMTWADVSPDMAKSFALASVAIVPPLVFVNMIKRRWPWIVGVLRENINGGRMFFSRGDGTFDVRRATLEDHARAVFGCESALSEPAPAPALDAAA